MTQRRPRRKAAELIVCIKGIGAPGGGALVRTVCSCGLQVLRCQPNWPMPTALITDKLARNQRVYET